MMKTADQPHAPLIRGAKTRSGASCKTPQFRGSTRCLMRGGEEEFDRCPNSESQYVEAWSLLGGSDSREAKIQATIEVAEGRIGRIPVAAAAQLPHPPYIERRRWAPD